MDQLRPLLYKHAGNISAVAREMKRQRCVVDRWIKREEINVLEYRCPVDRPLLDDAYAAIERALDGLSLAIAVRWAA